MKKGWILLFVGVCICLLPIKQGFADDYDDEWQITSMPYFFAPGIKGISTVSGTSAAVDLSFSDLLDNFDVVGFSNRTEAWKANWGIIFDISYTGLDASFPLPVPMPTVDVEIEDFIVDLGAGYKLGELPLFDELLILNFEALGGLRYRYLKQEISIAAATFGGSRDWVEPFLGGRIKMPLTEKWTFATRADIGGFGIGSASDLTWNVLAGIGYQFNERFTGGIGYKWHDIDYEHGSGGDRFGYDVRQHGLYLTLQINW